MPPVVVTVAPPLPPLHKGLVTVVLITIAAGWLMIMVLVALLQLLASIALTVYEPAGTLDIKDPVVAVDHV